MYFPFLWNRVKIEPVIPWKEKGNQMNSPKHITYALLLFALLSILQAQPAPDFEAHGHVYYQREVLYNKHGTNPTFVDWNNDGKKDLVVGFHFEGRVYVYPNTGIDFPAFNDPVITLSIDKILIQFAEFT